MRRAHLPMLLALATAANGATLTVAQDGSGDHLTIDAAVAAAVSGDTIMVAGGLYAETVNLGGKDLTIAAADPADPVTIDGESIRRCLVCEAGEIVTLDGLRFFDGFSASDGGCVLLSDGIVSATNCQFDGCEAQDGGGVWVGPGVLAIFMDCTFSACDAEGRGGGMHVEGGSVTIDGGVLTDNFCGTAGGGLSVIDSGGAGSATVTSSVIAANFGVGLGDGVYSGGALSVYLEGTRVCDHDAGVELAGAVTDGGGNTFGGWCCPGDVDWDGDVDGTDVAAIVFAWGNELISADDREDVSRDGEVGILDLLEMLGSWGVCE